MNDHRELRGSLNNRGDRNAPLGAAATVAAYGDLHAQAWACLRWRLPANCTAACPIRDVTSHRGVLRPGQWCNDRVSVDKLLRGRGHVSA